MKAFDEAGQELLPYDWMRGGTNHIFGNVAFEARPCLHRQANSELTGKT